MLNQNIAINVNVWKPIINPKRLTKHNNGTLIRCWCLSFLSLPMPIVIILAKYTPGEIKDKQNKAKHDINVIIWLSQILTWTWMNELCIESRKLRQNSTIYSLAFVSICLRLSRFSYRATDQYQSVYIIKTRLIWTHSRIHHAFYFRCFFSVSRIYFNLVESFTAIIIVSNHHSWSLLLLWLLPGK